MALLLKFLLCLLLHSQLLGLHHHSLGRDRTVVDVDQFLLIDDRGLDLALGLDGPQGVGRCRRDVWA